MNKQIGVAFCPTDEVRTIATFDRLSQVWTSTSNMKKKTIITNPK